MDERREERPKVEDRVEEKCRRLVERGAHGAQLLDVVSRIWHPVSYPRGGDKSWSDVVTLWGQGICPSSPDAPVDKPMIGLRDFARHNRILAGGVLLGIGVFLVIAFNGAFELALLALGGLLALVGIVLTPILFVRRAAWDVRWSALIVTLVGAGLLVHMFVPGGDIIHGGVALASFGLGGFNVYQGTRKTRE